MIDHSQRAAILTAAKTFGWNRLSVKECGLILWAAFHYYVLRLKAEQEEIPL